MALETAVAMLKFRKHSYVSAFHKTFVVAAATLTSFCTLNGQQGGAATPAESRSSYLLGPNDQIKVWVLGVEEIGDKPIKLDPSGDLDLPLVGKMHAAGLTTAQLKAELVQRYSKELLKPQVSVELTDFGSQPVSIMGAVNHPGVHQLEGHKTLVETISLADGLRADAGPRVNISRQIQYGAIPLPNARADASGKYSIADVGVKDLLSGTHPAENIPVFPNDVITVPTAEAVFVIGEVKKPGEVILKGDGVTVLQALSSAQGFGTTPAPQNSKIVRVMPGSSERKEIPVDLRKILAGKSEDIAMRPNDILVVPPSGPKKIAARAMEAAIQAATGVAIWSRP